MPYIMNIGLICITADAGIGFTA